jgi:exodeoxyribonuclease V beta subunit
VSAATIDTTAATAFDVLGPLPEGTTVLEASAGTGKTYTIAALAARYVAEAGVPLAALMLVTFGREATRELRERVRERLVAVERALASGEPGADAVTTLIVGVGVIDDAERARRRRRLAHALAHFDEATIATTHQFCQDMLAGLGVAGDTDADARFVEQIDDVVTEVVDDFYVRAYAPESAPDPPFDRSTALALGRAAVGDPTAVIAPDRGATTGDADARSRFAVAVREEVDRRKRTRRLYTFDDMLTRLHAALVDPRLGEAACARLRQRYRVVLVDEFQDTDPVQWDILRVAFHGHATLTVIGDPKQAIYAFRGADVVSYLDAAGSAGARATLVTNHRSDAGLLSALDTVFGGAALGDPRIVVHPVEAAHRGPRLGGAPDATPFRLRVVPRAGLRANWRTGLPEIGPARARVAEDLTADVSALLAARSTWDGRPLGPGDVAVLVRTNAQADLVRDALAVAGVPAVLAGAASVFGTDAAREWLTLLEAIEQPGRATRVRAAALTCFVGRRAAELDADPDGVLAEVGEDLRRWGAVLRDRGVAAMLEAASVRHDLVRRVLATRGGERQLTDVRHVGQVLHAEGAAQRLGVIALAEWLRLRIVESEGRRGEARPERTRRLESDDDAVQVLTVHKCKGLEFPVVHVPFGWDRWVPGEPREVLHHDAAGRRVRAVGGPSDPAWNDHCAAQRREDDGEDLRLLYVALTRAQGQVVAWWAPSSQTASSALNRMLRSRGRAPGFEPDPFVTITDDTTVWAELAALTSPELAVEAVEPRPAMNHVPQAVEHGRLDVARFDRELDLAWRRSSYSSLTADAHAAHPGLPEAATSEPEESTVTDEADLEVDPVPDAAALPSPMADLPFGAAFGVLVHAVLETVDTAGTDLEAALAAAAAEQLARRPLAGVSAAGLAAALEPVVRTPVERPAGGAPWAYADIAPRDRLTELDFELPLAGGDRVAVAQETVTLGRAAALLRAHLPADDPLAAYPEALETLSGQVLRGYLTGSIDAVLRAPDGRFVIVDHKTNWLGPSPLDGSVGEPLTSAHYGPAQMTTAMIRAHYPLQALLYGVALHRFLRWRLPGYDPATHLGGVAYLFLRGMCGPDTPRVEGTTCGVFRWSPPPALLVALSDLLAGRAS